MDGKDLKKFMEYGQKELVDASAMAKRNDQRHLMDTHNIHYRPLSELSDQEIYRRCREYGMNAKLWIRKFAALLPEVAKRNMHRRRGFVSLGEFAAKLAGMSEYAVDRILQLYKRIHDKPNLLKIFETGAEGWSKIDRVSYVATKETDEFWSRKILLLSKPALEAYVQNYRLKSAPGRELRGASEIRQEPPVRFSFPASRDLDFDLRLAKQTLEKQSKQTLSWNDTFKMLVQKSDFSKTPELCSKCTRRTAAVKICEECSRRLTKKPL